MRDSSSDKIGVKQEICGLPRNVFFFFRVRNEGGFTDKMWFSPVKGTLDLSGCMKEWGM